MSTSSNDLIGKLVKYKSGAAPAMTAPHAEINALNPAMIPMMKIHVSRETFQ